MGKSKRNGTNFLVQGSILAIASIISRIIGLVYRIPMTNIIGDVGIGYYGCAFEIYNIVLIISSYSLPLAVSKMVSASVTKGKYRTAYQVLKGALLFALVSGTIAALVVWNKASYGTLNPQLIMRITIPAVTFMMVGIQLLFGSFFIGILKIKHK